MSNTAGCEIEIRISPYFRKYVDVSWLKTVLIRVLAEAGARPGSYVSLFITGESTIKALNYKYRKLKKTTDVLSFSMRMDEIDASVLSVVEKAANLGEIVISYPNAKKQAVKFGHSTERELAILLIHSSLHLLDYDHIKTRQRKEMREKEARLLDSLDRFFSGSLENG